MKEALIKHYDQLAKYRDVYRGKHAYYYEQLIKQYRFFVPPGKRVLEVGSGTGELLKALKPSRGVGCDISPEMVAVAKEKFPEFQFYQGEVDSVPKGETFDYVILSGVLGELDDIQHFLETLRQYCTEDTRIIIEYYSYAWQYTLKLAEWFHLKMPQKLQNWVVSQDIFNFLALSGYEPIQQTKSMLCPVRIWGLSFLLNKIIAKLPIMNALTLNHFVIARPVFHQNKDYTVSIIVPCRNEKGNLEQAVTRTPLFGLSQEMIFIEGHSQDGTYEEALRLQQAYPHNHISVFKQTGKGKGDAVRLGFEKAKGDILMILDADLTVPPEELPKFYEVIRSHKGEFVNGCRLVYPMEKEAMRLLNLIANKFFGIFFTWLLGQPFRDTLCGTKVISKRHYNELAANRSYFGDFDPFGDFDLIFGATKLNLKIIELPIRYKNRQYGTTQIERFRHGLLLFRMCWFAMRKIKFI